MPECENVSPEEIQQSLSLYFKGIDVTRSYLDRLRFRPCPTISAWSGSLSNLKPAWIMYPKYYKDTDCATAVFNSISKHERRRANTTRPLIRHSVRLDKMASRVFPDWAITFPSGSSPAPKEHGQLQQLQHRCKVS